VGRTEHWLQNISLDNLRDYYLSTHAEQSGGRLILRRLINNAASTAEVIERQMNWEDDHELWVDKTMDGEGYDVYEDALSAFDWRDWGKL